METLPLPSAPELRCQEGNVTTRNAALAPLPHLHPTLPKPLKLPPRPRCHALDCIATRPLPPRLAISILISNIPPKLLTPPSPRLLPPSPRILLRTSPKRPSGPSLTASPSSTPPSSTPPGTSSPRSTGHVLAASMNSAGRTSSPCRGLVPQSEDRPLRAEGEGLFTRTAWLRFPRPP